MEKERRVKWLVIVSLIVAVLGLTIAFAALSETLTINGTATLDAAKWGIKFENITSGVPTGDATVNNEAEIAEDKVTINNIDVTLKTPGDSVTYKVDLVNEGTINAEISNIKVPELTEEQKRYIDFKVTYEGGQEVAQGDILNSGTTKNLTIKIEFKKDITASDLPSNAQQISLSYKLDFVQTDLTQDSSESGSGGQTGNYGIEIRSWDLSDTVKMTYYNGELQPDGTYDNGTLVISGTGEIPDTIIDYRGIPTNMPVHFKLADVSNFNEIQLDENEYFILKYNPKNLIVEQGITKLGIGNFVNLNLDNVILSNTVNEIGDYAFDSSAITNIEIPNVTTIDQFAFNNSTITKIDMPNVTTIGNSAFNDCRSLTSIYLPNIEIIGEKAFYFCKSLREIKLSNKIISIGKYAFSPILSNSIIYVPDEATKNKIPNDSYLSTDTTIVVDPTKF